MNAFLQASAAIEERSEWELCYARPSSTALAFLTGIARRQAAALASPSSEQGLDELMQLSASLQVVHATTCIVPTACIVAPKFYASQKHDRAAL